MKLVIIHKTRNWLLVLEREKQQTPGNVRAIYQTARWHMAKDQRHDKSAEKFYLGLQKLLICCEMRLRNFYQTALDFVSITNSELAKYLDMNPSLFLESLILTSIEEIMRRSNLSPSRYFLRVP